MPARSLTDTDLVDRLSGLFRDVGYDAASLQEISAVVGLQKSSLYHRFPGGKQEMASAVVQAIALRMGDVVLAPLAGPGTPAQRLAAVAANLAEFYEGGRRSCILEALSIGTVGTDAGNRLRAGALAWTEAFASLASEVGADAPTARVRAEDAIAAIEGALVLVRVTGETAPFERALTRLPQILLGTT